MEMDTNPQVLVCTSLRPSPRTRTFCRDLVASSSIFQYYVRGKSNMISLLGHAHLSGACRLWLIGSSYGNPKTITFYDVSVCPPTKMGLLLIKGTTLRREIKNLYPKSTRSRPLEFLMPEDKSLMDLYSLISSALPKVFSTKSPRTQLRLGRNPENRIELSFVESETGLPCGPKITVGDYHWLRGASYQP